MPVYSMMAPNGRKYDIEGPDGASDEDIASAILQMYPEAGEAPKAKPVTTWDERLKEAQGIRPGLDPDNTLADSNFIGNTGIPNPLKTINDLVADPIARGFEYAAAAGNTALDKIDELAIESGLADLPSKIGINQRLLPGSAIGALGEAFPLGGAEAGLLTPPGLRDTANRGRALEAANELFQNGGTRADFDALTKGFGIERFGEDLDKAIAQRDAGAPVGSIRDTYNLAKQEEALAAEAQQFQQNKEVTPLEQEAAAFRGRREPTPEDLFGEPDTAAIEANLQKEVDAFQAKKTGTPEEVAANVDAPEVDVQRVVDDVTELTKDWVERPDIQVHKSFEELPGADPEAIGLVDENGIVRINASKIDSPETLSAVTYHEALGHNGMTKLLGERLDKTLENFYDNSKWFRDKVDEWMEDNAGAYDGSVARAADEVLAELSQTGTVHAEFNTLLNRLKNQIIQIGRKIGIKKEFSEREINTILAMAHDAVINGTDAAANGFKFSPRYMMPKKEKKTLSPESMVTRNDVSDLLDFTADKLEGTTESYSIPELKRMADDLGLNGSKYVKQKGFDDQKLASRLLAAKQIFTNITDDLAGLGDRLRTEGFSPSLQAEIRSKLAQQEAVAARLDSDTAEIGRALRVLRETSESRKSAQAQARFSRENAGDVLSDPATLMRFMENYSAVSRVEGPGAAVKLLKKMRKNNPVMDVANIPRTLQSTGDMSAPFRQGLFLINRGEFWKGLPDMFRYFTDEKFAKEMSASIRERDTYPLMIKSKLALTDDVTGLTNREEQFMSRIAAGLPIVKQSDRAYSGFLSKLRADVFDDLVKKSKEAGIDLTKDDKALKDIASYVNNASGRGDLGRFEKSAVLLNSLFFSPRLIASRVNLLNPIYYAKLSPVVRKEALKSLASLGGIALTTLTLAKLAGADVEVDPRSSDFAKIKIGNTRYDILGGFGQYLTLAARMLTNEKKKLNGKVETLGEKFGSDTRLDVGLNFFINKESPVTSFVTDWMRGTDPIGEEFTVKDAVAKRFVPLFFQDAYEMVKEEGAAKGIGMALPGLFGVGTNTYESKDVQREILESVNPEIDKIEESTGKQVLGKPSRSLYNGRVKLDDEQYDQYLKLSSEYIAEDLKAETESPSWAELNEEERLEIIREVARDARRDAREELFPDPSEGDNNE